MWRPAPGMEREETVMERRLKELLSAVRPVDRTAMARAKARWDSIAKPLGSLGLLEEAVIRIAGIAGTPDPDL